MQQPTHVLIITRDDVIRNLLEQVFIIRDIQIVIAATAEGAEAIVDLWGLNAFGLVVIDTAAFGESESDQQHVACRMSEAWTAVNPRLPFIWLVTFLQKQDVQMAQADRVRVLVKPFRVDELVDAIETLYWGKRCLAPSPRPPAC